MNLTFITSNANKAAQLSQWLDHPVEHLKLDLNEIQTTNLNELVTHKAREAYQKIQKPVLVEDTALIFHALGNLPGPFIKFFLEEVGLENCCRILDPFSDRAATGFVTYGLTQDGVHIELFQGEIKGHIADHPSGKGGFGWDPIFIPNGYNQTRAEFNEKDYQTTSPRVKAINKLTTYINKII